MDFLSALSMFCLIIALQVTGYLLLTTWRHSVRAVEYAKAKPPPAPWIYGRPYLYKGRLYTYNRRRRTLTIGKRSLWAKHRYKMRLLLRSKTFPKKRLHRAHPALFHGRTRRRPALYVSAHSSKQPEMQVNDLQSPYQRAREKEMTTKKWIYL
jgi:hypothetical protein